jgi:hypothetical protein
LKNETITANKIKKGTITSAQIKEGSINSTTINVSTLATVPSAQTATTATNATNAQNAKTANTADEADSAKHAKEADTALHANEADTATSAGTATNAGHATSADDADTLEGQTGAELRGELEVTCSSTTEFYGGMCWDKTVRPISFWVNAVKICGNAGGRLPSIGELIAYLSSDGNTPASSQNWSGDLVNVGGAAKVLTSDDNENLAETAPTELGYRCVFPRSN